MTLVVHSSVVVAALVDSGSIGRWAEQVLLSDHLVAPHLMPVEVGNTLRRATLAGEVSSDVASIAHVELQSLPVDFFPYGPVASRSWELRADVTAYDAWYVALAELLDSELATLDARLAQAPGIDCGFLLPP